MNDKPDWMPEEPDFNVPTNEARTPIPLTPIGTAEVWRYLEEHPDTVMLRCACSDEPRMLVHRSSIPMWKCAACGSHLFSRTER